MTRSVADTRQRLLVSDADDEWLEVCATLAQNPWFRHAAELHVASDGIDRASGALGRFEMLRPLALQYDMSAEAANYLREAIDTFLFGFDAASVALFGATVEQLLRDELSSRGIVTRQEMTRSRMTGHSLLERANREGLVSPEAYDAARNMIQMRNLFLHSHIGRQESIRELALKSMADLGLILKDFAGSAASDRLRFGEGSPEEETDHSADYAREQLLAGVDPSEVASRLLHRILPSALDIEISRRLSEGESVDDIIADFRRRLEDLRDSGAEDTGNGDGGDSIPE